MLTSLSCRADLYCLALPDGLVSRVMAKRETSFLPRPWPGNAWTAWVTLVVLLLSGLLLLAAVPVPSGSTSSNAVLVSLEYQEAERAVVNWGVPVSAQITPFKKEPAAASGKIIRGIFIFSGAASNSIPFLWQPKAGRLYLDTNRTQDLTGDPFKAPVADTTGPVYEQTFTNVHLLLNTASGISRVLADILLYEYGSQSMSTFEVRSFWQGKLTLQGRDWQAGLVQYMPNGSGSFDNSRLLLRPWERRNQPFNTADGLQATVPFSRKLFLDGRAWQLECLTRSHDAEPSPALQFTEQSAPLGELKITGQFVQRVILAGGPFLVVLDQPAASVQVPAGSYNQPDIALEQNGAAAYCVSSPSQTGRRISVSANTPAVLNVGGPLTNSVTVSREGRDLDLDYMLVGAGGESYKMATNGLPKPPAFAVYKDDKKIGSGEFEYG